MPETWINSTVSEGRRLSIDPAPDRPGEIRIQIVDRAHALAVYVPAEALAYALRDEVLPLMPKDRTAAWNAWSAAHPEETGEYDAFLGGLSVAVRAAQTSVATTAEDLDALPKGTVLSDAERWLWLKYADNDGDHPGGEYQCGGNYGRPWPAARLIEMHWGPFEVLYRPGGATLAGGDGS